MRGGNRVKSRITTLDFKRAGFDLFQDLFKRILWDMALERRGVQERWLSFQGSPPPSSKMVHLTGTENEAKVAGDLHG